MRTALLLGRPCPDPGRWIYLRIYLLLHTEDAMGKPLMLQEADDERIESLKKRLKARTKIDVVRSALDLLERDAERTERVARWRKAAAAVAPESRAAIRDFRPGS